MAKKTRLHSWFVTLPLAGVAAAYVALVFFPAEKAIGQAREEIHKKQEFCSRIDSVIAALRSTRAKLEETKTTTDAWREKSPTLNQLSGTMGHITELAHSVGARITRFDPEPIVRRDTVSEFPVTVGCRGTFAEVFRFLGQVEALPEAIWVNGVKMSKVEGSPSIVTCEVSLVVFMDNSRYSGQDDLSR